LKSRNSGRIAYSLEGQQFILDKWVPADEKFAYPARTFARRSDPPHGQRTPDVPCPAVANTRNSAGPDKERMPQLVLVPELLCLARTAFEKIWALDPTLDHPRRGRNLLGTAVSQVSG
jgi:hypothetical protein